MIGGSFIAKVSRHSSYHRGWLLKISLMTTKCVLMLLPMVAHFKKTGVQHAYHYLNTLQML